MPLSRLLIAAMSLGCLAPAACETKAPAAGAPCPPVPIYTPGAKGRPGTVHFMSGVCRPGAAAPPSRPAPDKAPLPDGDTALAMGFEKICRPFLAGDLPTQEALTAAARAVGYQEGPGRFLTFGDQPLFLPGVQQPGEAQYRALVAGQPEGQWIQVTAALNPSHCKLTVVGYGAAAGTFQARLEQAGWKEAAADPFQDGVVMRSLVAPDGGATLVISASASPPPGHTHLTLLSGRLPAERVPPQADTVTAIGRAVEELCRPYAEGRLADDAAITAAAKRAGLGASVVTSLDKRLRGEQAGLGGMFQAAVGENRRALSVIVGRGAWGGCILAAPDAQAVAAYFARLSAAGWTPLDLPRRPDATVRVSPDRSLAVLHHGPVGTTEEVFIEVGRPPAVP